MRPRTACLAGCLCLVAAQLVAWGVARLGDPRDERALPPAEFAGTLMLGGFRGLACDLLWLRAVSAKEAGRFYESVALAEAITRVQPRFVDVWQFLAHDLAYNIAFEADGEEGKWAWFVAGVRANVRGCERNPEVERLVRHLAWIFHHKGDTFHGRIEGTDWAPFLNGVLAQAGGQPLPAGSGLSNFQVSEALHRACIVLATREGTYLNSFVRRMVPHSIDSDGNRLRNRGQHRDGLLRWLDAIDAWAEVASWSSAPPTDDEDRNRRLTCHDAYERNEGRVRQKAAFMARQLAPDAATGERIAAAIEARRTAEARAAIAQPGWKASLGQQGRIRFLDE